MMVQMEHDASHEGLQRLIRQRAALIARLKKIEDAITLLSAQLDSLSSVGADARPLRNTTRASRRRKNFNYSGQIREFAKRALFNAGHPMTRSELVREAERSRIPLPAGDLAQFFGRVLWRSDDFIHVDNGYWLSGSILISMQADLDSAWYDPASPKEM